MLAELVKEAYEQGKGQTIVPDNIYDGMMAKIMALPEKKRHKWHHTLTDKWGTKTKCIYKEGQIYNVGSKSCPFVGSIMREALMFPAHPWGMPLKKVILRMHSFLR